MVRVYRIAVMEPLLILKIICVSNVISNVHNVQVKVILSVKNVIRIISLMMGQLV